MKVRRQHNGDKDASEKKERKKGRRSEGEGGMKKNVWTCGQTALRSQRAPILSADVDNGAAVETEGEGGVCVSVCECVQ